MYSHENNYIKKGSPEYKIIYYNKFCDFVKNNNGIMLSECNEYNNAHTKLKIKCSDNHVFYISLNNLNKTHWCSECKIRKHEKYTKACIETLTDKVFEKVRPKWLVNKEGNLLELDMYNEELKLAVEYNGIQHYEFISYFYKTKESFLKRQKDDEIKIDLCKKNNINLIVVPYYTNSIKNYLINALKEFNIEISNKNLEKKIIIKNEMKDRLEKITKEKNGKILSDNYNLTSDIIQLECDKNHIFEIKIKYLFAGSWCQVCGHSHNENSKNKISNSMIDLYNSEKGKKIKAESHIKRSETMKKEREELRKNLTHKICNGYCGGKSLSIDMFNKKNDTKDGLQTYCKTCVNLKKKEYKK